ncbi:MAG: NifB/NifX family molybdenum-iron cluster-binding protein [Candidatus Izemoplasmataceae bacterium]
MIRKKRYCRRLEAEKVFKPQGIPMVDIQTQILLLDEFEAIRLCDYEGYSQIEAAEEMDVSRATIQRLLERARKKIVEAFLNNQAIELRNDIANIKLKGENKMNKQEKETFKVAFPTSDKVTIDGHFGHTKEFAIYDIKENEVVNVSYVTPPPHEPGVLPRFLGEANVDVIITGGMGKMAADLFKQQNIDVVLGANGRIDVNLNEYLGGFLTNQGSVCEHDHNHGH